MNDELTRLQVRLPHHWGADGELLWAERVGDDTFRLHNTPLFAYGLNFLDTVRTEPDPEGGPPHIREVVETSGHQTLRISFRPSASDKAKAGAIAALEALDVDVDVEANDECYHCLL